MASSWEKLDSEIIFEHPRIILVEDTVRLPGGQETKYLTFGEPHNYPTIIAQRDDGRILVTEEHAYPVNDTLLQFPEGLIDGSEDVITAARRELAEEAGLTAKDMVVVGSDLHNHRRSKDLQYIVYATGVEQGEKATGDVEEGEIVQHWFAEGEIWQLIAEGKIIQKNALAAWAIYQGYKRATA